MSDRRFAVLLVVLTVSTFAWLLSLPGSASAAVATSSTARGSASHTEFCPGVAVTTFQSSAVLADRKNLTIQNLSSATCYASFEPFWTGTTGLDPTAPTTTGSHGFKFAPGDIASFDFGPTIPLRAACTAATTTGACLQVMQVQ